MNDIESLFTVFCVLPYSACRVNKLLYLLLFGNFTPSTSFDGHEKHTQHTQCNTVVVKAAGSLSTVLTMQLKDTTCIQDVKQVLQALPGMANTFVQLYMEDDTSFHKPLCDTHSLRLQDCGETRCRALVMVSQDLTWSRRVSRFNVPKHVDKMCMHPSELIVALSFVKPPRVEFWDLRDGVVAKHFSTFDICNGGRMAELRCLCWSPNGAYFSVMGRRGVHIWDVAEKKCVCEKFTQICLTSNIWDIDSKWFLTQDENVLTWWDVTGKCVKQYDVGRLPSIPYYVLCNPVRRMIAFTRSVSTGCTGTFTTRVYVKPYHDRVLVKTSNSETRYKTIHTDTDASDEYDTAITMLPHVEPSIVWSSTGTYILSCGRTSATVMCPFTLNPVFSIHPQLPHATLNWLWHPSDRFVTGVVDDELTLWDVKTSKRYDTGKRIGPCIMYAWNAQGVYFVSVNSSTGLLEVFQ